MMKSTRVLGGTGAFAGLLWLGVGPAQQLAVHSLLEARVHIEDWRIDYNDHRPHTAHGDLPPPSSLGPGPPTSSRIAAGPLNGSLRATMFVCGRGEVLI